MNAIAEKYSNATTSAISISLPELLALRQQVGTSNHPPKQVIAAQGEGYCSKFRGRGMEFAEVRNYQAGDDIRSIDWRVTARTGKPHTKLFHEERERPTLVAIDYRRPMFFATHGQFKAVKASQLAALIAWKTMRQGDRLGAFIFSEEQHTELRPRLGKRAVLALFNKMVNDPVWQRDNHQPFDPQQRLFHTLMRLRRVVRPGSAVIIISDFVQWDENVEKQLTLLGRSNDLSLIFCFDQLEAQLPPAGNYPISNGNQRSYISSVSAAVRQQYTHQFNAKRQRIEQFCQNHNARFTSCATNETATNCFQRLFGSRI
ncbi:MAG: DUF58 domain-containing protein [Desulfobacteraceae bacterium 4572_35.1]|nr:MAG: DUF58 domain-containing protein [Desulfobacteraceae bacterium 4572_35.1]